MLIRWVLVALCVVTLVADGSVTTEEPPQPVAAGADTHVGTGTDDATPEMETEASVPADLDEPGEPEPVPLSNDTVLTIATTALTRPLHDGRCHRWGGMIGRFATRNAHWLWSAACLGWALPHWVYSLCPVPFDLIYQYILSPIGRGLWWVLAVAIPWVFHYPWVVFRFMGGLCFLLLTFPGVAVSLVLGTAIGSYGLTRRSLLPPLLLVGVCLLSVWVLHDYMDYRWVVQRVIGSPTGWVTACVTCGPGFFLGLASGVGEYPLLSFFPVLVRVAFVAAAYLLILLLIILTYTEFHDVVIPPDRHFRRRRKYL